MRQRGLSIRLPDETKPDETKIVEVAVVSGPNEIAFQPDDFVILTMKSQDTEAALEDLRLAAGDSIAIGCCQNGVANETMALRRFANVYGMMVIVVGGVAHLEPGIIEATDWPPAAIIEIGRFPAGNDAIAQQVETDFREAGMNPRASAEIMRWKYAKLLTNMNNAVQAVCPADAESRELATLVRAEAEACFAAAGIDYASNEEMTQRRATINARRVAGSQQLLSSTWQSLQRGAGTSEVDYISGEIALLGRLHGVPTPANEAFQYFTALLARERRPPGSISAADVRQEIARREAMLAGRTPA
jgi:2-dehydropantoate 2-reductase